MRIIEVRTFTIPLECPINYSSIIAPHRENQNGSPKTRQIIDNFPPKNSLQSFSLIIKVWMENLPMSSVGLIKLKCSEQIGRRDVRKKKAHLSNWYWANTFEIRRIKKGFVGALTEEAEKRSRKSKKNWAGKLSAFLLRRDLLFGWSQDRRREFAKTLRSMNTAREFYLIKSISRLRCKEKRVRERKTFQFTRRTLLQLLQVKLSALPLHC